LAANSFEAPFTSYNFLGSRKVSPHWTTFGDTSVSKNYVRFTTDRQSKRGYAVNTQGIQTPNWIATLKFRISGQGEKLFGDGLALWFMKDATDAFTDSTFGNKIHGGPAKFTGFAVIIDTFKNSEVRHKDIRVVVGNGSEDPSTLESTPEGVGCDMGNLRYWEKRQDFDASTSFSQLRVSFDVVNTGPDGVETGTMRIQVDPTGKGEWQTCVDKFVIGRKISEGGWWSFARLAISATTGGVADNHDVISLNVQEWTPTKDASIAAKLPLESDLHQEAAKASAEVIKKTLPSELLEVLKNNRAEIEKKIADQHHEFEHSLERVQEALANEITKRKAAEESLTAVVQGLSAKSDNVAIQGPPTPVGNNAASPPPTHLDHPDPLLPHPAAITMEHPVIRELRQDIDTHLRISAETRSSEMDLVIERVQASVSEAMAREKATDDRMQAQLSEFSTRILELETMLHVQKRERGDLLGEIHSTVTTRLAGVENHLTNKIDDVSRSRGGWVLPLLVLTIFVVSVALFGYSKYKKLARTHMF
jgi:mannose-binding lectin 2